MTDLVVLNHLTTRSTWEPVLDRLPDDVVTFLDVPGFGDTPMPLGPPSIQAMARRTRDQLDEEGLQDAHLIGISMAGAVALEVARLGGCGRVTAISPPGFWTAADASLVLVEVGSLWASLKVARPAVAFAGRSTFARGLVWRRLVAHPERVPNAVADEIVLGAAHNMRHLVTGPRTLAAFAQSLTTFRIEPFDTVPVTIAWGRRDRFTPFDPQARRAREVLPHARHVTLDGCGHIPTFDDPEQVARVIRGVGQDRRS